jgi:hypothetical protein
MESKTWLAIAICAAIFSSFAAPAWSGEEQGSGTVTYGPAEVDNRTLFTWQARTVLERP